MNTVRSATLSPAKVQIEGTLYMSYVQAAVYNAVTTISGRYMPYGAPETTVPGASPRAAVAAAAYTTLAYYFPTLASAQSWRSLRAGFPLSFARAALGCVSSSRREAESARQKAVAGIELGCV